MTETETKLRLLNSAYELMLSQGYAATGVSEICAKAGVSKGSFYHFFETKQKCALEMLWHHMEEAEHLMEGFSTTGMEPCEAALACVKHFEELSEKAFHEGCLFGAFALELADSHPELQGELSKIFQKLTDGFEQMLGPIAEACTLPDAPSAGELASQMITVIEGGVVLTKAHKDLSYLPRGIRLFRHYLQMLCGVTVV